MRKHTHTYISSFVPSYWERKNPWHTCFWCVSQFMFIWPFDYRQDTLQLSKHYPRRFNCEKSKRGALSFAARTPPQRKNRHILNLKILSRLAASSSDSFVLLHHMAMRSTCLSIGRRRFSDMAMVKWVCVSISRLVVWRIAFRGIQFTHWRDWAS